MLISSDVHFRPLKATFKCTIKVKKKTKKLKNCPLAVKTILPNSAQLTCLRNMVQRESGVEREQKKALRIPQDLTNKSRL